MVNYYQATSIKAKQYTVPTTGTVQQCESYQLKEGGSIRHPKRVKTYYALTINYETDSVHQRTIELRDQRKEYQKGDKVALMCDPDSGEAIRKSETVQDPKFYIFMSLFSLATIAGSVLYLKH